MWEQEPTRMMYMGADLTEDVVIETGDPEIDDIERRLAAGEDPEEIFKDWGEDAGSEKNAKKDLLEEVTARMPPPPTKQTEEEPEEDEFNDDYGGGGLDG